MMHAFYFDIWHDRPESHNQEGLDCAIDIAMGARKC
jgi:hypothetical protein